MPDGAENGDTFIDGVLTKPVMVEPAYIEPVIVKQFRQLSLSCDLLHLKELQFINQLI